MATVHKVLGNLAPTAGSLQTVYTVPASTEAIVSTITLCNRAAESIKVRVAVRPNAAVIANDMYIYYDLLIPGNETFATTIGITMDASDDIQVYTDIATLSVNIFGQEIS